MYALENGKVKTENGKVQTENGKVQVSDGYQTRLNSRGEADLTKSELETEKGLNEEDGIVSYGKRM